MSTSSKDEPNTPAPAGCPAPTGAIVTPSVRRPLHPALDFDPETGRAAVGVLTRQNQLLLVIGALQEGGVQLRTVVDPGKELVYPAPERYQPLAGRWEDGDLRAFLGDSPAPTFAEFLGAIKAALLTHTEFSHLEDADVVACWIAGTYFYPLFTAFPRLNLQGGKGSGKSKVLQLIAEMAHNGLLFVAPTAAILFRLIELLRPTLCLDEMERLDGKDDKPIRDILNAGYKAGATVPRVEGDKERKVVSYNVYAPVALAGIKGLNEVLADRAITITMRRALSKAKLNREVVHDAPEFRKIRAMGYRLALVGWGNVANAQEAVRSRQDEFSILSGRLLELYRPLIALGVLAKAHGDGSVLSALSAFVQRDHATREPLPPEESALFRALEKRLRGADSFTVYGADLVGDLSPQVLSAKTATSLLKRFFEPGTKTKHGLPFHITRKDFEERARQQGYPLDGEAGAAGQPRGESTVPRAGQAPPTEVLAASEINPDEIEATRKSLGPGGGDEGDDG